MIYHVSQHALMLPVLVSHLRYFACLTNLYKVLDYSFKDPMLLRVRVIIINSPIPQGKNLRCYIWASP